jgi:broad specificity phosphatase PhoE
MTELLLVRHGETVGQSSIRLFGATDVALSDEGELQMEVTGRSLAGLHFDRVLTSPLVRARRSAEVLLEHVGHPAIVIEPIEAFREVDFGRWEGWTWAEVRERDPDEHRRFTSEGLGFRFPEGESRQSFLTRVQAGVPVIEQAFADGCERVLVVVHKGVIKAIAARLLGLPAIVDEVELALASVHRFTRHFTGHPEGREQRRWQPSDPAWLGLSSGA